MKFSHRTANIILKQEESNMLQQLHVKVELCGEENESEELLLAVKQVVEASPHYEAMPL